MTDRKDTFEGFTHGPTDHDGEPVQVNVFKGLGVAVVPKSATRLDPELQVEVAQAMRITQEVNDLLEDLDELVARLRDFGVAWSVIGWATGMTGEGARTRFGGQRVDE